MGYALFDWAFNKKPDYAGAAARAEKARQQAITTGTANINNAFAGFNAPFFNQRAQAYINFAMPQLAQQYGSTRDQIGYGLANKGLRGSGAAKKAFSDLTRTYQQSQQQIGDTALSQSNALQRQVQDARNALITQLYQSADPANAQASAISTAAGFQQPSVFAPLANTFAGLVNQYYANQILNPRPAAPSGAPVYGSQYGAGAIPAASFTVPGY